MRRTRLQNKVATSFFTFPAAVMVSTLLWWSGGVFSTELLLSWVLCGITAYLWVETNNTYSLLRIRSRMTSSVYVLLMGVMFFLHPLQPGSYAACSMLVAYYLLLGTYQQHEAVAPIFHAFLTVGAGSLFFPQELYFVPVFLWYAAFHLRSLTWRTFWAAMAGVALPYWFWAGYCFYADNFAPLLGHLRELTLFQTVSRENYSEWSTVQTVSVAYTVSLAAVGILHYIRTSFNDKIRTRTYLYILLTQELLLAAFLLLQPVHFNTVAALLVMNSAPFISHYFALTGNRFSHLLFILSILGLAALAVLNLWMLLSTY